VGFLKDMKNMRDTAAEHGGMPNLKDAMRDMSKVVDDRGERQILKSGISAKAIVRGVMMQAPGDRFAMHVPLEVIPPQGAPYEVDYVFTASRMQAPLTPGLEVAIKISTEDPNRIAVQWDAQKAAIAAAGGALAATQQGLANIGSAEELAEMQSKAMGGAPMAAWQTPAAASAGDAKSRLEQLEQLKSAGVIDAAEYKAKRQQILDEL
jgi:Short C-terminal domain